MNGLAHRFPRYGTVGLVLLLLMQTAVFCAHFNALPNVRWETITAWTTPVCWWGYLLVLDAWLFRRKGLSWFTVSRQTFVILCVLSIAFWSLFEAYNRVMPGWEYINLEPNLSVRFVGYALAFATIGPGLFITAGFLQTYNLFNDLRTGRFYWSDRALWTSVVIGAVFCLVPPFAPEAWRGYLWAFVWTGWFFLLEPFNYWRGAQSLYRDWERGQPARTLQLMAAGAICGLLWEFWNMWAHTKWVYIFPLGQDLKLFEMPVVGFLGFLPFALEFFVMFHFVSSFFTNQDRLGV